MPVKPSEWTAVFACFPSFEVQITTPHKPYRNYFFTVLQSSPTTYFASHPEKTVRKENDSTFFFQP